MSQKPLLTEIERRVYEALLKLGEATATPVMLEAGLKRATTYKTLYSLEKLGLVTIRDTHKKIHFKPESPAKLLELAEGRVSMAQEQKDAISGLIPVFSELYLHSTQRPVVKIYEGVEGIKQANLEVLAEKKEILAYVYVDAEIDKAFEKFWKKYYAIRKRDKIFVKAIVPDNIAGREYKKRDIEELRLTKLLPQETFPIKIEKNIVGNKVVFFSWDKEKLIATVIENEHIANAERVIFENLWVMI